MRNRSMRGAAYACLAVILIWGLCSAAGSSVAQGAATGRHKVAKGFLDRLDGLRSSGRGQERVRLIVQTWGSPGNGERAAVGNLGGTHRPSFGSIHGFPATLPASAVEALARNPRIRRISEDSVVKVQLDVAAASTGALAAAASSSSSGGGLTGKGVTVAVLDSGVAPYADLASGALLAEVDIVEPDGAPADPFGHGTHVAGIIAGSGAASNCSDCFRTFRGIAPGARIVSVKVLNREGWGNLSDIIAGVDWVIQNHEAHGIRVLNMSLGYPVQESYATDPLGQAVEMAWRAGIVVVVSAGNYGGYGYSTVTSPANHPLVITVGAADDWDTRETTDDLVASFSSRGPTSIDGVIKPDLTAPGTAIVSLRSPGSYIDNLLPERRLRFSDYRTTTPLGDASSPYVSLSGTSMAAPVVAGAAAILLEQDPTATPDDIKARLMVAARKLDDSIVARGAGLLDIPASLQLGAQGLVSVESRSPHLRVVDNGDGTYSVEIQDVGTAWGDPITWSSEMVWGQIAIWGVSSQWSDSTVWSEIAIWGARAQTIESQIAIWGYR